MNPRIVLIHPPVVKPSEPPAGVARLSACLNAHGIAHEMIDANLEGLASCLKNAASSGNTQNRWDVRACKNWEKNLSFLQNSEIFSNCSRYSRTVSDINHVLALAGKPYGIHLSLADYTDSRHSAVDSRDLYRAAETPETNPFFPYFAGRLEHVLNQSPEYIGFSLNYLSQAICTLAMIGFVKKIHPGQKILLGGSLATSWMQITGQKNLFPDLVEETVAGAGEEKLLSLLGIKKLIDSGPSIDYGQLETGPYLSPGLIFPYSAARGCWWRKCAFCPETAEANLYEPLLSARVSEELSAIANLKNPSLIHFLDSSMAPALLRTLANRPPGAPWYGFARVTKHLTDENFCRMLKKSGCVMLKLGIESGDQAVLDALNKGIHLQTVSLALKTLKRAGIAVYAYFLFGTPAETPAAAQKTLDFLCRHAEYIQFLNLALFNLPVASNQTKDLKTKDFYEGDLSLYKSFHHPHNWQRPQVRHFLEKKLKKHPAIAPIVRRTPVIFTSNHAPFFVLSNGTDQEQPFIFPSAPESVD